MGPLGFRQRLSLCSRLLVKSRRPDSAWERRYWIGDRAVAGRRRLRTV